MLNALPNPCMVEACAEAEAIMFSAINKVLAKMSIRTRDIEVVVVNRSLFNPMAPSFFYMIVNHYKLRGNVASYNLGGMGVAPGSSPWTSPSSYS
jgi:3-ketoacyl-CoA synthase